MDVISWKKNPSFDENVRVSNIHNSLINQAVITQSKTLFQWLFRVEVVTLLRGTELVGDIHTGFGLKQ